MNKNLIEGLENEIIGFKDNIQNPSMKMLISEYEKALVEIGWNPDEKIKITKRGEYKTSSPFQCCLKNRVAVLKRAYDYFYCGKSLTLEACFEKSMERFGKLINGEVRSTESAYIYRNNFKRFFGRYEISKKPICQIKASTIHEHLEDICMEQKLSSDGLADAKTVLGKAFNYAYNHDIITNNLMV